MKIRQLPSTERPRERCLEFGAETLSLRESLAVLLGSGPRGKGCLGLADELLKRLTFNLDSDQEESVFRRIYKNDLAPLTDLHGLGEAGRARLLCLIEFSRRYAQWVQGQNKTRKVSKEKSYEEMEKAVFSKISLKLISSSREWIGFCPVYAPNDVGEFCLLETGVRTHVHFQAKQLFSKLLSLDADGFFLLHNHPSGNSIASEADQQLTHQLLSLSKKLSTPLLGHGIVTTESVLWMEVD